LGPPTLLMGVLAKAGPRPSQSPIPAAAPSGSREARLRKDLRLNSSSTMRLPFRVISKGSRAGSCDYVIHHTATHIGQAEVAAAIALGQLLVVDAQQMEDGRVQVVNVNAILDGVHAELVGRPVGQAALDPSAGQEHREAGGVMIAAHRFLATTPRRLG